VNGNEDDGLSLDIENDNAVELFVVMGVNVDGRVADEPRHLIHDGRRSPNCIIEAGDECSNMLIILSIMPLLPHTGTQRHSKQTVCYMRMKYLCALYFNCDSSVLDVNEALSEPHEK